MIVSNYLATAPVNNSSNKKLGFQCRYDLTDEVNWILGHMNSSERQKIKVFAADYFRACPLETRMKLLFYKLRNKTDPKEKMFLEVYLEKALGILFPDKNNKGEIGFREIDVIQDSSNKVIGAVFEGGKVFDEELFKDRIELDQKVRIKIIDLLRTSETFNALAIRLNLGFLKPINFSK